MSVIYDQGQKPWDDGTANSPTKTMFGDMDIIANNKAGVSYADQLAFYESNPNQQGGGGIGGGVHQKLVAGAAAEKAAAGGGGGGTGGGGLPQVNIDFDGGKVDMGDDDLNRSIAKERAQRYKSVEDLMSTTTNTITNDIEQNIGNSGDYINTFGNGNTITGSNIGNNYSANVGSLNLGNKIISG